MQKLSSTLVGSSLLAAGIAIASSTFSAANAASLSFTVNEFTGDDAQVKITLDDTVAGAGKVQFQVQVLKPTADIRGLFFDILNNSLLSGLSISGSDVTGVVKNAGNVINLGNGNNLNGGGTPGPFDIGVEIGTPGIGSDDIQSTLFTASHSSVALTVAQFFNQDFGVRLTSVGTGNNRGGSSKLGGTAPSGSNGGNGGNGGNPTSVPEPGTTAALGLFVLGGLGFLKKNKKQVSHRSIN